MPSPITRRAFGVGAAIAAPMMLRAYRARAATTKATLALPWLLSDDAEDRLDSDRGRPEVTI